MRDIEGFCETPPPQNNPKQKKNGGGVAGRKETVQSGSYGRQSLNIVAKMLKNGSS